MTEPTPRKGVPRVLSWAKRRRPDPDADHHLLEIGRRAPDEAAALSLRSGDAVTIASDYGVSPGTLFATFHFPESGINNVTSDVVDRLSDCPEYKLTPVMLAPRQGDA